MTQTCKIEDCNKPADGAKGWCSTHYARYRRHGSPHVRKAAANGEPLKYFNEVVLTYEGDECLLWPFGKNDAGYAKMHFNGKNCMVSRLVCEQIEGPAPTPEHQAAHSCGKGHHSCVTKKHLSWKTPKENSDDKHLHGTQPTGKPKINRDIARRIRLSKRGNAVEIAEKFGVSPATVLNVQKGRFWSKYKRKVKWAER